MNVSLDEQLKEMIIRNTRKAIEAEEITPDTDLVNELALDSILVVNLFADLEEELSITINPHDITKPILSKFSLFHEFVLERIGERAVPRA